MEVINLESKKNYKIVNINFNLDNEKDLELYNYLKAKRGRGNFIKDLIESYLAGDTAAPITNISKKEEITIDDTDIDEFFNQENKKESGMLKATSLQQGKHRNKNI